MNPIDNPNEDTEFNDALRKHGILPPRPVTPRTPSPPPSPRLEELLSQASTSALEELGDEAVDSDTERMIESYRRQRIKEIEREQKKARFGTLVPIGRDEYSREVTEASKADDAEEGSGTGVVCYLYKDGHPPSVRLTDQLRTLASKYPRTKFVSIIGDKCIENYPDRLLPTLLMYRGGEIAHKVSSWGADRDRYIEELEALLIAAQIVVPSQVHLNGTSKVLTHDSDSEEEPASTWRSKGNSTKIRGPTQQVADDDSDFDL